MSAVGEIEAAIAKLTELRNETTPAPWTVEEMPETGECRIIREFEHFGSHIESVTGGGSLRLDADLIVTLHRTIDAQLEVLRIGMPHSFSNGFSPLFEPALTLARAINGTA